MSADLFTICSKLIGIWNNLCQSRFLANNTERICGGYEYREIYNLDCDKKKCISHLRRDDRCSMNKETIKI